MEYRQLGRTGTRVSTLCLGAMNFNDGNTDEGVATIKIACVNPSETSFAEDRMLSGEVCSSSCPPLHS